MPYSTSEYREMLRTILDRNGLKHYTIGQRFRTGQRARTFALHAEKDFPLIAKTPIHRGPTHLDEFTNEVNALRQSSHQDDSVNSIPRIRLFTGVEEDLPPFLVQERVGNLSIADLLAAPLRRRLILRGTEEFLGFARLLDSAHQAIYRAGWIHGDLSPNNIRVTVDKLQRIQRVHLIDFGSARKIGATYGERVFATAGFVAPRQLNPQSKAEVSDDRFSLGCILYALTLGTPPTRDERGQVEGAVLNQIQDLRIKGMISKYWFGGFH